MKLFISKEIEEKAGIKAERASMEKDISSWRADVVSINRRKTVIFLNESTGLVLLLYRPSERDFIHLADAFISCMNESFKAYGIEYSVTAPVEVFRGENKTAFSRVKERIASLQSYMADEDRYLFYISYMLNSRVVRGSSAIDCYCLEKGLKVRDLAAIVSVKYFDGTKPMSLMIPYRFTLDSLSRAIRTVYGLDEGGRFDFTVYDNSEKYSAIDCFYRPEVYRAMDEMLDAELKNRNCEYALARSSMLGLVMEKYPNLVYRSDLYAAERFSVSFDSFMEGLSLKAPMVLSIKWADDGAVNRELKGITS